MKKHKPSSPRQGSSSNSNAEVFVLPPELLAKLGINLVNIQQSETIPTPPQPTSSRIKETEQSIGHSISNQLSEDSSSIIETANLMKESVFLSPTFFQTPSIISNEEEPIINHNSIVKINNTISSECVPVSHQRNSSDVIITPKHPTHKQIDSVVLSDNVVNNTSTESSEEQVIVSHNNESDKKLIVENYGSSLNSTDAPNQNAVTDNIQNNKSIIKNLVDDHADEAYLSDCSNSYSGCSPESMSSEKYKNNMDKNKVIPHVADHLQSNNIQDMDLISLSSDLVPTPVIIDSVNTEKQGCNDEAFTEEEQDKIIAINGLNIDGDAKNGLQSKNINSMKSVDLKHMKTMSNINKETASTSYSLDNSNNTCQSTSYIDNESVNHDMVKQNSKKQQQKKIVLAASAHMNANAIQTNLNYCENIDVPPNEKKVTAAEKTDSQDRVKEIATYLSQIAHERKNKTRRKSKNKEKEIKVDPIISKLCIQGVEKPGGQHIQEEKLEVIRVYRTYRKAFKNRNPQIVPKSDAILVSDFFQLTNDMTTQIDSTEVRALECPNKFCICFDFGNLAYYDCEMLYEHIHFWIHNNNECDSETLYSIYNEDFNVSKLNVDFVEDGPSNEKGCNNTIQDTLCWNKIHISEDNYGTEYATNDSKLLIETSATDGHKPVMDFIHKQPASNDILRSVKGLGREKAEISILDQTVSEVKLQTNKEKNCCSLPSATGQKLQMNSTNTPESSKHAKNTEILTRKSISSEADKIDNATIVKSSKKSNSSLERHTTTKSAIGVAQKSSEKSSDVVIVNSPRSPRTSSKRKSSVITASSIESSKNKNDSFKNVQMGISNTNNERTDISKSTRFLKLKSEAEFPKRENSHEPTQNVSEKASTFKKSETIIAVTPPKTDFKTKSESRVSSKSNQKLKSTKPEKRSSNTTGTNPPTKKAKIEHSVNKDDIIDNHHTRTEKASQSKCIAVENRIKSENPSTLLETAAPDDSTIQDSRADMTNIETVLSDDNMLIEVSILLDTPMNETQADDSMLADSTIVDNIFNDTQPVDSTPSAQISNNLIKCGVCGACMNKKSQWVKHIGKEHDYLAWRDGDTPLNLKNEAEVKTHLQAISNKMGGLQCSRCNLLRKKAKPFLRHIQSCTHSKSNTAADEDEVKEDKNTDNGSKSRKSRDKKSLRPFTCGVCNETVEQSDWIEHIRINHKYLAWTTEETPLNLEDETEVKQHLNYISKNNGGLICNTCGSKWAYVKKYLTHSCESRLDGRDLVREHKAVKLNIPDIVSCGVCKLDVEGKDWIKHIQVAHEYMAWIGGEKPVNFDNPEEVKSHLDSIALAAGELICSQCGERRRHAHAFLQHRSACLLTGFDMNTVIMNAPVLPTDKDHFVCGVCHESGKITEWYEHAMTKHYNIAWKVGEVPINLRNPYAVEKYLKVYKKKRGLVCLQCNESRTSCYGFYAHILTCGRTPEEIEGVLNECEICENKYLCIYRNQHMAAHRDSDMRREKREMLAKKAEEEETQWPEKTVQTHPTGKRRAAEKAKKVIQKHSTNMIDGKPICGCGAMFQNAAEFSEHNCDKKANDGDDSDESVKMEQGSLASDEDDDLILIDSGLSDEEEDLRKRKRSRVGDNSSKVVRLQYKIDNQSSYLAEAYTDFVTIHYTGESLFNIWRNSDYVVLPSEETANYLPHLTESCKIRFGKHNSEWTTYKRFEARKISGYSLFTGGAIQCLAWVPPNINDESLGLYLAISTHRGPDVPRHAAGERPIHPGSLQIWHFGRFATLPYCALCLAHDYGIVWAMDWCPSGASDAPSPEVPLESRAEASLLRLGLLAIACSNGSVYILAVPVPPSHQPEQEPPMYKLNPVAELRLAMTPERRVYQATSVKWSPQKGHSVIIVGYSDGTTALFDLNTESPFLVSTEKCVTVYYPFQDRRSESSSITSVGVLCTRDEWCAVGGQFSTSVTGGTLRGRAPRPLARCHLAASGALLSAHWPALTLAGDVPFMRASSEMEWWGSGRRLGAARAWAACSRCARAASAAQPALRLHHQHPVYPEIKKLIAALLLMVPLQKKKRKENDDLSVVLEPITYDDAAAKYGLQLLTVPRRKGEQALAQQICNKEDFRPDRFPLSDIVAMAFCPSTRYHDKLAAATHTGFVFVLNT